MDDDRLVPLRMLSAVAVSGAAELVLLMAVGSQATGVARLGSAGDDPAAAAAAIETALLLLASTVALVAWTGWCLALAETLIALASHPAGSVAVVAGTDGDRRHRRSTAVLLVLGLSAAGAAAPAAATGWNEPQRPRLDGLRLPDLPAARIRAAAGPTGEARCRPSSVVVAPGDSLWTIAAEHLAAEEPDPTVRAIDRTWPQWHAHNRDVIGPDPDLLLPGQRLEHPLPDTCLRRTVR